VTVTLLVPSVTRNVVRSIRVLAWVTVHLHKALPTGRDARSPPVFARSEGKRRRRGLSVLKARQPERRGRAEAKARMASTSTSGGACGSSPCSARCRCHCPPRSRAGRSRPTPLSRANAQPGIDADPANNQNGQSVEARRTGRCVIRRPGPRHFEPRIRLPSPPPSAARPRSRQRPK